MRYRRLVICSFRHSVPIRAVLTTSNHRIPTRGTRKGAHITPSQQACPAGSIPRYSCNRCNRGFGRRTFSIDYFTKKLIDYPTLITFLASCMGIRQISRATGLSIGTISNRFDRFARQAIGLSELISSSHTLSEDLAADEFETFSVSQFFPEYYHLLVGTKSQYLYFFTHMKFKRKGRMSEEQKRVRELLYQRVNFERGRQSRSFGEVMEKIAGMSGEGTEVTLYTDEKKAYETAIRGNEKLSRMADEQRFSHEQTPSGAPRTFSNPLFAVNYYDREIRKDGAAHVRESVRFNRNVSGGLMRLACYGFYHNFIKRFRIRDPVGLKRRHYREAGIDEELVRTRLEKIYDERVFISRELIEGFSRRLWFKEIQTPLKRGPEYVQKFWYR